MAISVVEDSTDGITLEDRIAASRAYIVQLREAADELEKTTDAVALSLLP